MSRETHIDAFRSESLPVTREAYTKFKRVCLRCLVLPDDNRLVDRAWVGDDPRDPRPDVVQVGEQLLAVARAVHRPGYLFEILRGGAAQWDGQVELHPPTDVDERVPDAEVLHELADAEFLH